MKERVITHKSLFSTYDKKQNQLQGFSNLKSQNQNATFSSLLKKDQRYHPNNISSNGQILNCFNNISAIIQQDQTKHIELLKCKKTYNRSDEQSQLPKFSSIQESLQSSIDKTLIRDHIMLNQIYYSNNCQNYDQYSFNGDKTDQFDGSANKYVNTKTKYLNLIQKIDHFLVKDFAIDDQKGKIQKQSNLKAKLDLIKPQIIQKQQKNQLFSKSKNTLQNQFSQRQGVQDLTKYVKHLQDQNYNLKNQKEVFLLNQIKLKEVQKLIYEKDIVIQYLSKQLNKKYSKNQTQIRCLLKKQENINLKDKPSNYNSDENKRKQIMLKQRNTISGSYIQKKKNIQKKRASQYDQIDKQKDKQLQAQQKFDQFSGSSYPSKNKSISFMKKIFRKSQQNQKNPNSKSQLNVNHLQYNLEIIEVLKQQNQILSTKLNILYGDLQQIIDKYNQVLTQKSICRQICCKNMNENNSNSTNQNIITKDQQYQNNPKHPINQKINQQKPSYFQTELNRIIYFINNNKDKIAFRQNHIVKNQQREQKQSENLFSNQQLEQLNYLYNVKQTKTNNSNFNNYHTDRTMDHQYYENKKQQNLIKMSLDLQNFRKIQGKNDQISTEKQYIQRQNTNLNQQNKFKKIKRNQINQNNKNIKYKKRQKIAPKQSMRDLKKSQTVQYMIFNEEGDHLQFN